MEDRAWSMRPKFSKLNGALREPKADSYYTFQKELELEWLKERIWFSLPEAEPILPLVSKKLQIKCGTIIEMGMQLSEDIVVMIDGRMKACFFAFPSGWSPHEKKGMTLTEIHAPVADGKELREQSERISNVMHGGNGPWYRYVWTIAQSEALSIHPDYPRPRAETIDDLWFRYEYQTFDTVVEGSVSVFLVKTTTVPFLKYCDTKEKREIVKRVINSMSEDVLSYKGLHEVKRILQGE